MVDERLEALRADAPHLTELLSSSNVLLHVPERYVDAAVGELVQLLDLRLMGVHEAATEMGTSGPNIYSLAGMPKPVAQLACGTVWLARKVEVAAKVRRDHKKRKVHAA